jgi:aminopeptidase N
MPDGRIQHIWWEDHLFSTYLFGFAAGKFEVVQSTAGKTRLDFYSELIPPKTLNEMFKDTGGMIAFFEEKSGVPFPHPSYAQVVVPGDDAQEASSFSIIGTRSVSPVLANPKEDWVIVHELAHQWWGNEITCASWDHFWLNEGMVVFMTAAYKEARWGKTEYIRELEIQKKRYQFAKGADFDVPLTKAQTLPTLQLRRAIVYSKGALFLDALRKQMGETAFWGGLKEYSRKYAGKTVESSDFQKVMEAKGGEAVTQLFKTWVY